jgi:ribose transport system ATP-binding protein
MSLVLSGVHKSFGGVCALTEIDFAVSSSEIVGLAGPSGAGKSTLLKLAAGIYRPNSGSLTINGFTPFSPAEAARLGVAFLEPERTPARDLDVRAKLLLAHAQLDCGFVDPAELTRLAASVLQRVGGDIPLRARLSELSLAQQQRVEIAQALSLNARIVLLDAAPAPLSAADEERLFTLLRQLRAQGLGIVYVSQHPEGLRSLTDRVVCLRDGKRVAEFVTASATRATLAQLLRGAAPQATTPLPVKSEEVVLSVRGSVNFDLRRGEILGLASLAASEKTSVFRRLLGEQPSDLRVALRGKPIRIASPDDAQRAGILLRAKKTDGVLSKSALRKPSVLLLDEPTSGLSPQAKQRMREAIRQQAQDGNAVVVSSSQAEELSLLCHRALVLRHGAICGELARRDISEANILRLAT